MERSIRVNPGIDEEARSVTMEFAEVKYPVDPEITN
jgi:hypothetical protein